MSYNSNFEIAVVAINLLVLTSFFLRGMTNGYHNRVFLSLITTATAAAIAKSFYSIAGKNALYLFFIMQYKLFFRCCNFTFDSLICHRGNRKKRDFSQKRQNTVFQPLYNIHYLYLDY